jgi:hypothetical protein
MIQNNIKTLISYASQTMLRNGLLFLQWITVIPLKLTYFYSQYWFFREMMESVFKGVSE